MKDSLTPQQQQKLLNIIAHLLSYGTRSNEDDDNDDDDDDVDYGWSSNDELITVPHQLSSGWDGVGENNARKRSWLHRGRALKRGPGSCINSCLTGGMSFVRCKSMCHWYNQSLTFCSLLRTSVMPM